MQEYNTAVRVLNAVVHEGRSLEGQFMPGDSALSKQIVYGVVRNFYSLSAIVDLLVKKPLTGKNARVQLLLLAGIYSVDDLKRPAHTSVNALVSSAATLQLSWAKGLLNGVLRNYLRQRDSIQSTLPANQQARLNHPAWLLKMLAASWPNQLDEIVVANNARPPMTLRVNNQRIATNNYLALLDEQAIAATKGNFAASAIYLASPTSVTELPGFGEGLVSVQDEASQLAAGLLACKPGMLVLDACAAPGGKTTHLLESYPDINLTAIDLAQDRIRIVEENLQRLSLTAHCEVADLRTFTSNSLYDRILLDAPCSATGIIRRHPDIKLLRRNSDIAKLAATQLALLGAAWQLLAPGGLMVYSTCSILPIENEDVMSQFCAATPDAMPLSIEADWGQPLAIGRQLLPREDAHDGFYYARLIKQQPS